MKNELIILKKKKLFKIWRNFTKYKSEKYNTGIK